LEGGVEAGLVACASTSSSIQNFTPLVSLVEAIMKTKKFEKIKV
jgi:hypothetical protein